jgi:hypothetical protein
MSEQASPKMRLCPECQTRLISISARKFGSKETVQPVGHHPCEPPAATTSWVMTAYCGRQVTTGPSRLGYSRAARPQIRARSLTHHSPSRLFLRAPARSGRPSCQGQYNGRLHAATRIAASSASICSRCLSVSANWAPSLSASGSEQRNTTVIANTKNMNSTPHRLVSKTVPSARRE